MLKVILTGGPCAGKTQILSRLMKTLEERGYFCLTAFEVASTLILNGIKPCEKIPVEKFQGYILDMQLANEDIFEKVAREIDTDKVVILYDRGIMDNCAYIDKETVFKPMLTKKGLTFDDVFSRYDAVFHLVTAADGAEDFYEWNDPSKEGVGNNAARFESPEEARIRDEKTLNAWIGHPHLCVVDNSTDFEGKVNRVVDKVLLLLGETSFVPTKN